MALVFTIVATAPRRSPRSIELWHHRRLRRDLLVATALLPLAEIVAASEQGYALDRWIPLQVNPAYDASAGGAESLIGQAHVLCRLAVLPPPLHGATGLDARQTLLASHGIGGVTAGSGAGAGGTGIASTLPTSAAVGSSDVSAPGVSSLPRPYPSALQNLGNSGFFPAGGFGSTMPATSAGPTSTGLSTVSNAMAPAGATAGLTSGGVASLVAPSLSGSDSHLGTSSTTSTQQSVPPPIAAPTGATKSAAAYGPLSPSAASSLLFQQGQRASVTTVDASQAMIPS